MNNEHQTSYALLIRSEEKGRSLAETTVYALLGLSAIISILQFTQQLNPRPINEVTSQTYAVPHIPRHQLIAGVIRKP
ncbi:MAG: hypothetical protein ABI925_00030 [Verrucomicrobiota bacterium]